MAIALAMGEPEDKFVNFFMTEDGQMIFMNDVELPEIDIDIEASSYLREYLSKRKK